MTTKNTFKSTFREIAAAHIAYVLSPDYEGKGAVTTSDFETWLNAIEWHFAELPREDGKYDLTIATNGDATVFPVDVSDPEAVRTKITPMALFRAVAPKIAEASQYNEADRLIKDALCGVGYRSDRKQLKHVEAGIIFSAWGGLADYYFHDEPEESGEYKVKFWDKSRCIEVTAYIDIYDIESVERVFNPHNLYYSYVRPQYLKNWTEIEAAAVLSHSRTNPQNFFNSSKGRLEVFAWGHDNGTLGQAFKDMADEGMDYLLHDPQTTFYKGYIVADTAAY